MGAQYRGTYRDEAGYQKIFSRDGCYIDIVERGAKAIGLQHGVLSRGSIGVIGSETNLNRQFGGIFDGNRWMVRLDEGFSPMIAKPLTVWGGF